MSNDAQKSQILIAEDHELVRQGLKYTLNEAGFRHILMAENGLIAFERVKKNSPDIVLMDIGMPVMNGIESTQKIKASYPKTKVIILTSHQDSEEVLSALCAGADAYCMKDIAVERLIRVIQEVEAGALWLDPAIAHVLQQTLCCQNEPSVLMTKKQVRQPHNPHLTQREVEVLTLIVDGKSNKEIAIYLKMSPHTVKSHVTNIIQKLAVEDRTQAAVKALREEIIRD